MIENLFHPDKLNLRFYETNKLIVFTKAKVASRTCDGYFSTTSNYVSDDTDIDLEDIGGNYMPTLSKLSPDLSDRYTKLTDIKKNKKDILLLYRNPLNRLLSGIIQDNIIEHLINPNFLIRDIIRNNCTNSIHDVSNSLKAAINSNINNINNTLKVDVDLVIGQLIKTLVNDININLSLEKTVHIESYLHVYDYFINEKFDRVKVSLINIDNEKNDLNNILSKYELINLNNPTLFKHSNSYLVKSFIQYINLNDINLREIFHKYLYAEQYFYNKFEKSELNILNK